ncbi:hypothetical protein [Nocardioides sp.]|uniref:PspA-associated protein PspAB n=1 Tax=Nocardioides sp. TaxID=35761 RepID=UPI0035675BDF
MGLWEAITGRSKVRPANLDSLFLIPSAAITLQTAAGLTPTGDGSVCYRSVAGAGFHETQSDLVSLLNGDRSGPDVAVTTDDFGYTWLQTHRDPSDMAALCTDLHAVNTSLEAQGFGSGLLCSLVPFTDTAGRKVGLVYLYKQGSFYPFAPTGPQQRDNLLEIQVRDTLRSELPIEQDLSRWMALWGAPGL